MPAGSACSGLAESFAVSSYAITLQGCASQMDSREQTHIPSIEDDIGTGAWYVRGVPGRLAGGHAAEGVSTGGAARSPEGLCDLIHGQLALWIAQNAGAPLRITVCPDA